MTPALGLAGSSLAGKRVSSKPRFSAKATVNTTTRCNVVKKKENRAKKQGTPNDGVSAQMKKKGFVDAQGTKGKGRGVYQFESKYGSNVDGYSPIYTPNEWSDSGGTFKAGKGGLIIWAGVLGAGLLASA